MASSNFVRTELSQRQFRQIVCRSANRRAKMRSVWAITWRPGGYGSSFLGKLFRPLGLPLMMAQVSYPSANAQRECVDLFGISAQVEPRRAAVSYDRLRLQHQLERTPFLGARGRILNAACDARGGQQSWIQLALEVDSLRQRAADHCYRLSGHPRLPKIYFGYGSQDAARYEVTPALIELATASLPAHWSVTELADLGDAQRQARDRAFAALSQEDQDRLLRQTWQSAFVPPTAPTNSTGLWLLDQELSTDIYPVNRAFEDFSELVGSPIYNVARKLGAVEVSNPAIELAREAGFDLAAQLASLANTSEGCPEFLAVEERLIELVPKLRQRTGASSTITDQELLNAICEFEKPVIVCPPLDKCSPAEQIRRMRQQLKPHLSECCTDADLLGAVQNPNGPLWAAGLCSVQTLRRNTAVPLEKALRFTSEQLSRERVEARFWFDSRQKGKVRLADEALVAA